MNERVLLAGCGDVGMRVAQRLLARGDHVYALRRHLPTDDTSGIQWLRGDLVNTASLHGLPSDITQLVYLPTPDRRDEAAYRSTFVDGLRHVLNALDRTALQRAVFVSSSAVYGEHHGAWVDETTPERPYGFNGEVLLEAEQWLAARSVPSIALRLAGLYGPGRLRLLDRLRHRQVRVPRSETHWANRMHTDDAAKAIVHLLQLVDPLPLYLGADDTPLPLDVLYDALARMIGVDPPEDGLAPAGVGNKRLSNRRLFDSGFKPDWPDAREGYAAMLDN